MEENNLENKEIKGNNSQQQIVGAILLAGILIAGAILLKGSKAPTTNESIVNNTKNKTMQIRSISLDDHILGNANAEIVIVEYSDLECPYCKVFHSTMHRVVDNSDNSIAWVYRHYPIPELHLKAFKEAEASECAFEQGGNDAFWKYIDRVFEITPSNDLLDETELPAIAKYIGLNVESFDNCLQSGKFEDKVRANIEKGIEAGVNGTPSSFIMVKGRVIYTIPGAQPYETVMQKLSTIK